MALSGAEKASRVASRSNERRDTRDPCLAGSTGVGRGAAISCKDGSSRVRCSPLEALREQVVRAGRAKVCAKSARRLRPKLCPKLLLVRFFSAHLSSAASNRS
jgi:hypothetical protein